MEDLEKVEIEVDAGLQSSGVILLVAIVEINRPSKTVADRRSTYHERSNVRSTRLLRHSCTHTSSCRGRSSVLVDVRGGMQQRLDLSTRSQVRARWAGQVVRVWLLVTVIDRVHERFHSTGEEFSNPGQWGGGRIVGMGDARDTNFSIAELQRHGEDVNKMVRRRARDYKHMSKEMAFWDSSYVDIVVGYVAK